MGLVSDLEGAICEAAKGIHKRIERNVPTDGSEIALGVLVNRMRPHNRAAVVQTLDEMAESGLIQARRGRRTDETEAGHVTVWISRAKPTP